MFIERFTKALFSLLSLSVDLELPPRATNGLRLVSSAVLISSSGRLIPSATGTSTTFYRRNDLFQHEHLQLR